MRTQAVLLMVSLVSSAAFADPAAPKKPVVSEYGGVKVSEDYRWLEDSASPDVHAWSDAQNKRARAFVAALPAGSAIRARVTTLLKSRSPMWYGLKSRGGQLFAMKTQPPKQQPFLVVRASAQAGTERVL